MTGNPMRHDALLDLRTPAAVKRLIETAAHIEGVTVSSFVVATAARAARQVIDGDAKLRAIMERRSAFTELTVRKPA
jgi:uncharacterized protein (DUF1778 family)